DHPAADGPGPGRRPSRRPRGRPRPAGRGARARRRARRGHPRPQLPAARGPGRRGLRRRLARPLPPGRRDGQGRHRVLRRALHGRDGVHPVAGQARPHPRPQRGLLARGLHHPRAAAGLAGPAPRRGDRDVRQHHGGGQGAHGLLRDLRQRGGRGGAHLRHPRRRHGDPLRAGHVPRRLRREDDRAHDARVGRGVPRPRRHPPVGHRAGARRAPRRRLPHPPRVRLLDLRHGVRRRGRRRLGRRPHALHGRDAHLRPGARGLGRHGDHGHRDGDAPPAADGRARRGLHRRQRARLVPLHEDDHPAQAARLPARHDGRGQGARGHRRARSRPDRAHGRPRV
ncbi:MAG: Quinolinate synthetase, partial [uncultured Solirubrobacteraceae bacterium]